jgi:3-isopropylmalate/(R)-2-methylmalate dehydratase small subunit
MYRRSHEHGRRDVKNIKGVVRKLGHGIDTDIIIPARHLVLPMSEMKKMAMEPIRPNFCDEVREGDIIVAGRNFGCGSSREQAPAVLKELGIAAIIAMSFARIFFRNAINLGIPIIECNEVYDRANEGDEIEINPSRGVIRLASTGEAFEGTRLPDFLLDIIRSGGLINHIKSQKAHLHTE